MSYDVIIIGAGHNGLVASFYLAHAGRRVLIVEGKGIIGGSCTTEELLPGYRFSTCANALWALRPRIAEDMGLAERGLKVESRSALRLLPGGRFLLTGTVENAEPGAALAAIQKEVGRFSAADAAALPRWHEFLGRLARIFGPWLLRPPPRLGEIYAACVDRRDREALDLVLTNSIASLADRFFESDVMRDMGVGADADVDDFGTGLLFGIMTALGAYTETDRPVANGFVHGGMGRLTELMRDAAVEAGVEIRTDAPVGRVLTRDRRATGVRLASGEELAAPVVISNLDPKNTFLRLVDPADVDGKLLERIRRLQTRAAAGMKFHCALKELPEYGLEGGLSGEHLRKALFLISPNRAYRQAAWQAALRGDLPDEPVISGSAPSAGDPTLAPPGRHTMSTYILWVPVRPRAGEWSRIKDEMAERIIRTISRYAPNFRSALVDYVLLTPDDLAERNSLTDGNIHHIDGIPSQLLWQRPLEELAHYRTPIAGFYLCGAGSHPWGEVSGAPGYNAAHTVLGDRAQR